MCAKQNIQDYSLHHVLVYCRAAIAMKRKFMPWERGSTNLSIWDFLIFWKGLSRQAKGIWNGRICSRRVILNELRFLNLLNVLSNVFQLTDRFLRWSVGKVLYCLVFFCIVNKRCKKKTERTKGLKNAHESCLLRRAILVYLLIPSLGVWRKKNTQKKT